MGWRATTASFPNFVVADLSCPSYGVPPLVEIAALAPREGAAEAALEDPGKRRSEGKRVLV
jgi:hypothetical protein